ncbi:unnamed protein product, partial [Polarella glacialis]
MAPIRLSGLVRCRLSSTRHVRPAGTAFLSLSQMGPKGARGFSESDGAIRDKGQVTGPRYYPSLSQTLRNTRGRELLRIVDTAVPNLKDFQEFTVILKALALDGQWRRALRLIREMQDAGIQPDLVTYNWVLSAMQKDKQVERAMTMLTEMQEKSIEPDLQSYNNCVGACKSSEWTRSLEILREMMPKAGISPDGQSFEHAAAACEEAKEWERSLALFMEIGKL